MLDVGLNATLKTRGLPLVIPPFTPPEPLRAVEPEGETSGSLCSEPLMRPDFDNASPYPSKSCSSASNNGLMLSCCGVVYSVSV